MKTVEYKEAKEQKWTWSKKSLENYEKNIKLDNSTQTEK